MRHDPKSPSVVTLDRSRCRPVAGRVQRLIQHAELRQQHEFRRSTAARRRLRRSARCPPNTMPRNSSAAGASRPIKKRPTGRGPSTPRAGLCRSPYVIAKGPGGGVMMHLADERQPTELRLKGSPEGKNYIGPDGDAGVAAGPRNRVIRWPGAGHALCRSRRRQPLRQHGLRALRAESLVGRGSADMTVTIWHNPKCATSRKVLASIRAASSQPSSNTSRIRQRG